MTISLEDIYQGSVASRLDVAQSIVDTIRPQLDNDGWFQNQFTLLHRCADELNEHMNHMDMGALCSTCAATPNGGCCSLYMSGETDAIQMAVNILAGIKVHFVRDDEEQCRFLQEKGCLFRFKPMFCLNYNCSHIIKAARLEDIRELERVTGNLLRQQYRIEQYILAQIS